MDCEKFESAMMDELYGELDELTSAAAKRHVAGCARCAALLGGLRATRRVAAVPMVDLPAGLEERILAAARDAQKVVPMPRRAARVVSAAGNWAMRPQTAMAALFLVMIGTSVLLIRGKPSRAPSAEVTVTEQGAPAPVAATPGAAPAEATPTAMASAVLLARAPESKVASPSASQADLPVDELRGAPAKGGALALGKEKDDLGGPSNASAPGGLANNLPPAAPGVAGGAGFASQGFGPQAPAAQAPADGTTTGTTKHQAVGPFDTALQQYRMGQFDDATRAFDALAPSDPNAELWAARSVREGKGCRNALARFDKVARRAANSAPGWDALLEGALCYRAIGDFGQARVRLTQLLKIDSHKDRAQAELDRINQLQQAQGQTTPPAAAARPSPKRAAAPAATAPNAASDQAY
ncbi:MAG TPA: zf-HC2 domain-containing protein [Polyangiaceae bacterium]